VNSAWQDASLLFKLHFWRIHYVCGYCSSGPFHHFRARAIKKAISAIA
jgi:hypothetical protein